MFGFITGMFIQEIMKLNKAPLLNGGIIKRFTNALRVPEKFPFRNGETVFSMRPNSNEYSLYNKVKSFPEHVNAFSRASGKCVEYLQGSKPKEYSVLFDETTGKVLQESLGNPYSVEMCLPRIKFFDTKNAKLNLLHGHLPIKTPKGYMTLPVSLQDFVVLNNSNLTKITAFDKRGVASILEKTEDFITLSERRLAELKQKYIDELLEQSPAEKTEGIKGLIEFSKQHPENLGYKRAIVNNLNLLQYEEGADIIIDGFWRKYANQYGLKYTSNFDL